VVVKLDRLSRSLADLLNIVERIGKAGAGFRSLGENLDTTSSAGRAMMQMVGVFAEFEYQKGPRRIVKIIRTLDNPRAHQSRIG
jgi:DNA invertase Pin-like site-specific DNA recombinase